MMKTFARPRLLVLALYIASAALVTVQQAILRHSNNVSIFRSATFNLFAGRDLYAAHPEQHFDFYKYSPTFAVLFAPLAYLPFALTFLCWTLLNGLLLWYALAQLAAAGRRHCAAVAPGRAAPGPLGEPRVPASVLVLAARLRGPVQSRLGVPIVRGRLRGDRDLVRELAAEPCAGGRDGPDAA